LRLRRHRSGQPGSYRLTTMKRLLAVAIALGLMAVALYIRDGRDDPARVEAGEDAGEEPDEPAAAAVLCATELEAACDALDGVEVRTEDAGDTADRLRDGDAPGADGWVVPAAALEVVESGAADALDGRGEVLASGEVRLAVTPDRADAVAELCPTAGRWRCLVANAGGRWGDLGGEPAWGSLRIGVPSVTTGVGMATLGGLAEAYFRDGAFAAQDFGGDFGDWLAGLARNTDPDDADPRATLLIRSGAYTAAAVLGPDDPRIEILDAEPLITTEVVLVPFAGGGELPDATAVRGALVADGWSAADGSAGPARYKPGVLAALRARWQEVIG
jgi:hypothetical protein